MAHKVEVDTKTFIRFWVVVAALVILLMFIARAATGLILVGISIFLAIAIWPLAQKFDSLDRKKKRPKLSAALAFASIVVLIIAAVSLIGPVVVNESSRFVSQAPQMFENTLGGWDGINDFGRSIGVDDMQGQIHNGLQSFADSIKDNLANFVVSGVGTIASIATSTILVLVLTLLFLLEGPDLVKKFWDSLKYGRSKKECRPVIVAERVVSRMANVISTYVSKQLTVAVLDGAVVTLLVFILSLIFNFNSGLAFPMGVIALIFYLIPMFGPFISCALISIILLVSNPVAGITFLVCYIVYAQIENNLIAPKLQGNGLGLSPVLILTAVTIGTYMFGLFGAIISIPIAGCIKVLVEEYPRIRGAAAERKADKEAAEAK